MPKYYVLRVTAANHDQLIENVNHQLNEILVPNNWRLVDILWNFDHQYEPFALLTMVLQEDEV